MSDSIPNNEFYNGIEDGVRLWVWRLREAGINTECSCHHEGYIQCQTMDPTVDVRRIKTVLMLGGVEKFEIHIRYEGWWFSSLEIRADAFRWQCPLEIPKASE